MTKKKIGLAGKSGSGKDLIADYINERYSYQKIAVADGIRNEVNSFLQVALGTEGAKFNFPKSFELVLNAYYSAIWAKPTSPEMRVLLQWWGTEYRRAEDSDYWIKRLAERLDNDFHIVISDVRTPREVETVRAYGGEVWYIDRPDIAAVGISNHYTEVALEGVEFDRTIRNDSTVESLKTKVDWVFQSASTHPVLKTHSTPFT